MWPYKRRSGVYLINLTCLISFQLMPKNSHGFLFPSLGGMGGGGCGGGLGGGCSSGCGSGFSSGCGGGGIGGCGGGFSSGCGGFSNGFGGSNCGQTFSTGGFNSGCGQNSFSSGFNNGCGAIGGFTNCNNNFGGSYGGCGNSVGATSNCGGNSLNLFGQQTGCQGNYGQTSTSYSQGTSCGGQIQQPQPQYGQQLPAQLPGLAPLIQQPQQQQYVQQQQIQVQPQQQVTNLPQQPTQVGTQEQSTSYVNNVAPSETTNSNSYEFRGESYSQTQETQPPQPPPPPPPVNPQPYTLSAGSGSGSRNYPSSSQQGSTEYSNYVNDNVDKPKSPNDITSIDTFGNSDKLVKPVTTTTTSDDLYEEKIPDPDDFEVGNSSGSKKDKNDLLSPDYSENSFKSKVSGVPSDAMATDADATGDPKCSSETLRLIMHENIVSSPTISKQLIFSAGRLAFGQTIDVICSRNKFSYTVVSSRIFCEAARGRITCFAFLQP